MIKHNIIIMYITIKHNIGKHNKNDDLINKIGTYNVLLAFLSLKVMC